MRQLEEELAAQTTTPATMPTLAMFFCMSTGALVFTTDSTYTNDAALNDAKKYRLIYTTDDLAVAFFLRLKSRGFRGDKGDDGEESSGESDDGSGEEDSSAHAVDDLGAQHYAKILARLQSAGAVETARVYYGGKLLWPYLRAQYGITLGHRNNTLIVYSKETNSFAKPFWQADLASTCSRFRIAESDVRVYGDFAASE